MKLRIIALVVVVVLLVTAVVFLATRGNGDGPSPTPPLPPVDQREQMTPEERARALLDSLPDGSHQGRLITIDAATVTVRRVEVFSGAAADAAAREDGVPEGASDRYVRDSFETLTLPLAGDPDIRIQVCAPACGEVPTTVAALAAGEAVPHGGGENVFVFTISGGDVVSLGELLLQ